MKGITIGILFFVAVMSASAQSADPAGITAGSRVRVAIDQGPVVVGSVVRLTPQTLEFSSGSGVRQVSHSNITSLEVSQGRPVHGGRLAKGALNGFLILGGAATLLIAADDPGWAFIGPIFFGPIGAGAGAVWSLAKRPEVWEPVPLTALTTPASGPSGLGMSATTTTSSRAAKRGRGRQIAIGALVGGAIGGGFAVSKETATPVVSRVIMIGIPSALLGGAIGAFVR
jgi:hypothetical protein